MPTISLWFIYAATLLLIFMSLQSEDHVQKTFELPDVIGVMVFAGLDVAAIYYIREDSEFAGRYALAIVLWVSDVLLVARALQIFGQKFHTTKRRRTVAIAIFVLRAVLASIMFYG